MINGKEVDIFGITRWYKDGLLHRVDGPAVIGTRGSEAWYFEGLKHRFDGPAFYDKDGREGWYIHGVLHREGGPALVSIRHMEWWNNGTLHREDGPARIYFSGDKEWYLEGKNITKEEWWLRIPDEYKTKALFNGFF